MYSVEYGKAFRGRKFVRKEEEEEVEENEEEEVEENEEEEEKEGESLSMGKKSCKGGVSE